MDYGGDLTGMIRVGFVLHNYGSTWLGGNNYFRNLIRALTSLDDRHIQPVLFCGDASAARGFEHARDGIEIHEIASLRQGTPQWFLGGIFRRLVGSDLTFELSCRRYGIDVLSHASWLRKASGIPSICWITDFQHLHLPQLFSKREINERRKVFSRMARNADRVIVSSHDAAGDFRRLFPDKAAKVRVLPFAVFLPEPSRLPALSELERKYAFTGAYLLVANQFWKHKNHRDIIDALAVLRQRGTPVTVLASGSKDDFRHPEFFPELMEHAEKAGVSGYFKPLGVIPYEDLQALMRHASAVLNPSLFEGWNTTVEEAKAIGQRVILSDIPVHREQNPSRAAYYRPGDTVMLAHHLAQAVADSTSAASPGIHAGAIDTYRIQQTLFGRTFQDILLESAKKTG